MRVIAVVSESAGVGKTLLVAHLAVQAAAAGHPSIALIDTDPRRPLGTWRTRRKEPTAPVVHAEPSRLAETLERLAAEDTGLAVIDTGPGQLASLEEALSRADLVLIPVAPTRDGLKGIDTAVDAVRAHGKPFVFVVNGTSERRRFTGVVAMALAQYGTVCPVVLPRRPEFAEALREGATALDSGGPAELAALMQDLWTYLYRRLGASRSTTAGAPSTGLAKDRRKHRRWSLDWDVSAAPAKGGAAIAAQLIDISGGGAALRLATAVGTGELLTLDIPTIGRFEAVVVYARDDRVGVQFVQRIGVKFIQDAEREWRLASLLVERMANEGERKSPLAPVPAVAVAPPPASPPAEPPPPPAAPPPAAPPPPAPPPALAQPAAATVKRQVRVAANRVVPSTAAADASANEDEQPKRGRIIVLGNEKGGSGKSTIAVHLAVALLRAGCTVASLDLDQRQASFSRYLENRKAFAAERGLSLPVPTPHLVPPESANEEPRLRELLANLVKRRDYVVIDTPGRSTPLSAIAHELADLVITPINDSFIDLDVLARLDPESLGFLGIAHYGQLVVDSRQRRQEQRRQHPTDGHGWIVVRNRLSALGGRNKVDMAEALERLAGRLGFQVGSGLSERVIYRELFLYGLTLIDLSSAGSGVRMSPSHTAAREELRALLKLVLPDGIQLHHAAAE